MEYEHYPHREPAAPIPFVDPAAVEAWDAWFRWREGHELRDITIEATWARVARALCALDAERSTQHARLVTEAISSWRLLVDARILAGAGQPDFGWSADRLSMSINLAAFVDHPFSAKAAFRTDALAGTVALALRLIDDVLAAANHSRAAPRLGIVGLADALALLGIDYTSDAAVATATTLARELAGACLAASSELARTRGSRVDAAWQRRALMQARNLDLPPTRLQEMQARGFRFGPLLSAGSQPRLALFANNVADALSPLRGEKQVYSIASPHGERHVVASGFAITLWRQLHGKRTDSTFPFSTAAIVGDRGKNRIRAALQPWFDDSRTRREHDIHRHAVKSQD
jgi:ribonucleoside-diphosphate reductase alpha chain